MADEASHEISDEAIRSATSETVGQGMDIREQVRDLTLRALTSRKLYPDEVRRIIRATTEGIALGAASRSGDARSAVADAVKGLDEAVMKAAEAGRLALEELTSRSRDFSEMELKQALADMKRIEEDFLSTVAQVAESAKPVVKGQFQDVLTHMRRSGTDTGVKVASTMNEFAQRMARAYIDTHVAGLEAAKEMSTRWAEVTSGFLAGLSEALRQDDKRS
jgi:hypothetical protein